jgi:hypothetical protein
VVLSVRQKKSSKILSNRSIFVFAHDNECSTPNSVTLAPRTVSGYSPADPAEHAAGEGTERRGEKKWGAQGTARGLHQLLLGETAAVPKTRRLAPVMSVSWRGFRL